jgi:hypothetical protein
MSLMSFLPASALSIFTASQIPHGASGAGGRVFLGNALAAVASCDDLGPVIVERFAKQLPFLADNLVGRRIGSAERARASRLRSRFGR